MRSAALILAALLAVAPLSPALAAGPDPVTVVGPPSGPALSGDALDAATVRVAKHLRCPVCQGLSVADSPSESARAMKEEARALVAQGYDDEQVLSYFEASYGEFIRLEPKAEGWNLLVWIGPPAVLIVGGLLAWSTARGWTKRRSALEDVEEEVIPADLAPYVEQVRAVVGNPR